MKDPEEMMYEDIQYLEKAMDMLVEIKTMFLDSNPNRPDLAEIKKKFDDHIDDAWYDAYKLKCEYKKVVAA